MLAAVFDLWLIRNAHTLDGQPDAGLSTDGEAQARTLATKLAGEHFDLVIASPLLSARRTAELALPDAKLVLEPRPRELLITSKALLDVTRLNPAAVRELTNNNKTEPHVETGREFIGRIRDWIGALPSEGRVIAFTHLATLRECLRQLRRGLPPKDIEHCQVHRVTR